MSGLPGPLVLELPQAGASVRLGGEYHGLVIAGVTQSGLSLLNLEHYTTAGRCGRFAPRRTRITATTGISHATLEFEPTDEWRLRASVQYQWVGPDTFDVRFAFTFDDDYPGFEAFVASYFPVRTSPPYIPLDNGWLRPQPRDREQVFVAGDVAGAARVLDGRWQELRAAGYTYRVEGGLYAKPLMVTNPAGDERTVIQMVRPSQCSQLSPNTFAPAHDLSLIGRDVRAGDTAEATVRLLCVHGSELERASEAYESFSREAE